MALRDLPPWRRPHTLGLASTGSDGYTRQILSAYEQQAAIGVRGAAIGALALPVPHNFSLDFMQPLRYGGRHGDSESGLTYSTGQPRPPA